MTNLFRRPDLICWGIAGCCCLLAVLFPKPALDIQLHDTYFVVDTFYLLLACLVFCLLGALFYDVLRQFNRRPWPPLTVLHLVLTATSCLFLLGFAPPDPGHHLTASGSYEKTMEEANRAFRIAQVWWFMATASVPGLGFLLLNVLVSFFFRHQKK